MRLHLLEPNGKVTGLAYEGYHGRAIVRFALTGLCALSRHAGGCWVLNDSPLAALWRWSVATVPRGIAFTSTANTSAGSWGISVNASELSQDGE